MEVNGQILLYAFHDPVIVAAPPWALRGRRSAPACCSGQTGSSSASCRRTSGGTLPSTGALPHLCCLGKKGKDSCQLLLLFG